MKNLKFIATIIFTFALSLLFVSTSFAGYTEVNARSTEEMYNKIVHFTHGTTLTNTQNENYIVVTNFNDLKNNTNDYSILLLDTDVMEEVDFDWIKSALQNTKIVALMEYEDLQNEMMQKSTVIDKTGLIASYNNNSTKLEDFETDGYYKISLESNQLSYGNCLVKATNTTKLLKSINMSLGKEYKGEICDEKITTVTEASDITRTAVNHPLRFYWDTSTDKNKIYETPQRWGNIIVNLYKGEVIYELGGEYVQEWTESNGDHYRYSFTKVHGLNNAGQYVTGYMLLEGGGAFPEGDGYWSCDFGWYRSVPLSGVAGGVNDGIHLMVRVQDGVTYYGVKIKGGSALYNSSGQKIKDMFSGWWVWITGEQNVCGANNHHYMTINAWSINNLSTIIPMNSTTFVDAGFNTSNPANYKITTRWW